MREVVEISEQLDDYRLIKAEARAQRGQRLSRGGTGFSSQNVGRITRRQLKQKKIDDHDFDDCWNRLQGGATESLRESSNARHNSFVPPANIRTNCSIATLRRSQRPLCRSDFCVVDKIGRPSQRQSSGTRNSSIAKPCCLNRARRYRRYRTATHEDARIGIAYDDIPQARQHRGFAGVSVSVVVPRQSAFKSVETAATARLVPADSGRRLERINAVAIDDVDVRL